MLSWPNKDENEVLDYKVDWTARLGDSDTLISSVFIITPTGLVEDSSTFDSKTATIWLSSGINNENYNVLNRVETAQGRIMDQTVRLNIRTR